MQKKEGSGPTTLWVYFVEVVITSAEGFRISRENPHDGNDTGSRAKHQFFR